MISISWLPLLLKVVILACAILSDFFPPFLTFCFELMIYSMCDDVITLVTKETCACELFSTSFKGKLFGFFNNF